MLYNQNTAAQQNAFYKSLQVCCPAVLFLVFAVQVSILSQSDNIPESEGISYPRNTDAQI